MIGLNCEVMQKRLSIFILTPATMFIYMKNMFVYEFVNFGKRKEKQVEAFITTQTYVYIKIDLFMNISRPFEEILLHSIFT